MVNYKHIEILLILFSFAPCLHFKPYKEYSYCAHGRVNIGLSSGRSNHHAVLPKAFCGPNVIGCRRTRYGETLTSFKIQ